MGEHAEFIVLEKLAGDKDTEGYTLYTTLEPCTVRTPPKMSCSQRILQRRIVRVVIGISDPNPDIHGTGIEFLLNHGICVDFFDSDFAQQIRDANKDFLKYFERASEELWKPAKEVRKKTIAQLLERPEFPAKDEIRPVYGANVNDLSPELIQSYLIDRGQSLKIPSPELWKYLYDNEFLSVRSEDGSYVPTYAGLLLFGKNPENYLPNFKVKALCFDRESEEHTPLENLRFPPRDICGPLSQVVEKSVTFVLNNVRKVPDIQGIEMVEVPEYPKKVLREALVNALVHRDYNLTDMNIILEVYLNRVLIRSPGYLMKPLTLERIRSFKRVGSRCRNPRIALTFNHMHKMEKLGFGIPSMPILLRRHGLRPPDFDYFDGYFVVTLFGRALSSISIQIKAEVLEKLNKRQLEALDLIQKHRKITSEEYTKQFQISRETANQDFKKLIDFQLIRKMGKGRGTYYVLKWQS